MPEQFYTLITGASTGFGKALATECARRGMNLILVALPNEGLPQTAQCLQQTFGVDAIAVEQDLCEEEGCVKLYRHVEMLNVKLNMLINNAGVGSTELFAEGSLAHYERQVRLNVLATTTLTHLFIGMLKKACSSYILNVGSLASFFSLPKKQVYGATKAFICYFSKSLRRELKRDNIFVSVVCPGGMFTNSLSKRTIATGNYLTRASGMKPEDVAPLAIDGLLQKKEVIVPGKINQALYFLNGIVPRFIVRFLESRTMQRLHTPPVVEQSVTRQVYALPSLPQRSAHQSKPSSHVRF